MGRIQSKKLNTTLPAIISIEQVQQYRLVLLWNTGETRVTDLSEEVNVWKNSNSVPLRKLAMLPDFNQAIVANGTLTFPEIKVNPSPFMTGEPMALDLDPINLYQLSKAV